MPRTTGSPTARLGAATVTAVCLAKAPWTWTLRTLCGSPTSKLIWNRSSSWPKAAMVAPFSRKTGVYTLERRISEDCTHRCTFRIWQVLLLVSPVTTKTLHKGRFTDFYLPYILDRLRSWNRLSFQMTMFGYGLDWWIDRIWTLNVQEVNTNEHSRHHRCWDLFFSFLFYVFLFFIQGEDLYLPYKGHDELTKIRYWTYFLLFSLRMGIHSSRIIWRGLSCFQVLFFLNHDDFWNNM